MNNIYSRVSIRKYQDKPVEKEKTEAIVSVYRTNCSLPAYAEIDLSIAMENLWLETDAQGLGGVWLGIAPLEDRMRSVEEILDIPDTLRAFAIFPYGYPAEERKQQITFQNTGGSYR